MQKISDDGKWLWNGTEWIPNEEPQEPVAGKKQVAKYIDGHPEWA